MDSLRGQLLIAGPELWDPNFRRTIILIGQHDDEGALGLVLNRPAELSVAEASPPLEHLVDRDSPLFLGGPMDKATAVVLAEFAEPERAEVLAFGSVGFLAGHVEADVVHVISRARVFAGYAGWGPGQLENELRESSWIIEPALPEDVFTREPDRLWGAVLRRKGPEFHFLATMPVDPVLN